MLVMPAAWVHVAVWFGSFVKAYCSIYALNGYELTGSALRAAAFNEFSHESLHRFKSPERPFVAEEPAET